MLEVSIEALRSDLLLLLLLHLFFVLALMLEDGGEEELDEDLIDEVLLLDDALAHLDVEVLNDLACQLYQADINALSILNIGIINS